MHLTVLSAAEDSQQSGRALVLLGTVAESANPAFWLAFRRWQTDYRGQHALDNYCRDQVQAWQAQVNGKLAADKQITAIFPDDLPPYPLVSRAAKEFAELHQSPLGMLVHERFGLMFGIRALLSGPSTVLGQYFEFSPVAERQASPCDSCDGQPCLTSCPTNAWTGEGFAVDDCAAELRRQSELSKVRPSCWQGGCLARLACPLNGAGPYSAQQAGFHHSAFLRARGAAG